MTVATAVHGPTRRISEGVPAPLLGHRPGPGHVGGTQWPAARGGVGGYQNTGPWSLCLGPTCGFQLFQHIGPNGDIFRRRLSHCLNYQFLGPRKV